MGGKSDFSRDSAQRGCRGQRVERRSRSLAIASPENSRIRGEIAWTISTNQKESLRATRCARSSHFPAHLTLSNLYLICIWLSLWDTIRRDTLRLADFAYFFFFFFLFMRTHNCGTIGTRIETQSSGEEEHRTPAYHAMTLPYRAMTVPIIIIVRYC